MASALTSWKEVAVYLGKGVRTVQRWESRLGLPVRRPDGRAKGTVLAFSEELDTWLKSNFSNGHTSELQLLRRELAELKQENNRLRSWVNIVRERGLVGDEALSRRCSAAVDTSLRTRLRTTEVMEDSRKLQAVLGLHHALSVNPHLSIFTCRRALAVLNREAVHASVQTKFKRHLQAINISEQDKIGNGLLPCD
jgi:hypothetical protein